MIFSSQTKSLLFTKRAQYATIISNPNGGAPMIINYNVKKLQHVLDDFCHVTGIRISLCDAKGRAVTRSTKQDDFCQLWQENCGEERCRACDAQLFRESLGTPFS